MPIQFACSHCRRTLSVTRRKAGMSVACPKCGQPTLVPQSPGTLTGVHPLPPIAGDLKEATDAPSVVTGLAAAPTASAVTVASPASRFGAFDDIPELIDAETVVTAPSPAAPLAPPQSAALLSVASTEDVGGFKLSESIASAPPRLTQTRLSQARRGRQADGKVLLVSRQAVYAQAGLMAGLLVLAFLAGLFIGRGQRTDGSRSLPEKTTAEPVALSGHILYALSPGDSLPDEGAVVIVLPAEKKPDVKVDSRGLRADDTTDAAAETGLGEIGAAVAHSDARGQFQLVVPRSGNYQLLVISSHATRPDDSTLPMRDAEELSKYFSAPAELIGHKRYTLISRRLTGAPAPLTHEFGPTDKQ